MRLDFYTLYTGANWFLNLISMAILAYCVLTWIAPRSPVCMWLARFISPFVMPFRTLSDRIRARWGAALDLSCWLALIAIRILRSVLTYIFFYLIRF